MFVLRYVDPLAVLVLVGTLWGTTPRHVHGDELPMGDEEATGHHVDDDLSARWAAPLELADPERGLPFAQLWPVRVLNVNSEEHREIRLYDSDGNVDEGTARELDGLLADVRDRANVRTVEIERRTLQLMFRAAYHFHVAAVEVISGYRQPGARREGQHGQGKAVDFRLPHVSAASLASYLRTLPLVGVGLYTHPRTQYVHLDVRERSYHWIDASPPGRSWRERPLGVPPPRRDAAYLRRDDWPEGTVPSLRAMVHISVPEA